MDLLYWSRSTGMIFLAASRMFLGDFLNYSPLTYKSLNIHWSKLPAKPLHPISNGSQWDSQLMLKNSAISLEYVPLHTFASPIQFFQGTVSSSTTACLDANVIKTVSGLREEVGIWFKINSQVKQTDTKWWETLNAKRWMVAVSNDMHLPMLLALQWINGSQLYTHYLSTIYLVYCFLSFPESCFWQALACPGVLLLPFYFLNCIKGETRTGTTLFSVSPIAKVDSPKCFHSVGMVLIFEVLKTKMFRTDFLCQSAAENMIIVETLNWDAAYISAILLLSLPSNADTPLNHLTVTKTW